MKNPVASDGFKTFVLRSDGRVGCGGSRDEQCPRSHRAVNPVELVFLPGQVIVADRVGETGQAPVELESQAFTERAVVLIALLIVAPLKPSQECVAHALERR